MTDNLQKSPKNCVICRDYNNIAFECGHILTCEICAFYINFCPLCNQPTEERLKISYNQETKGLTLELLKHHK